MEQGGAQGDGQPGMTGATRRPAALLRYGVALVLVAAALQLALLLQPYLNATPDAPFFAAVAVASWFGGLVPGLFATIASALAVDYFLVPPLHSVTFDADHFIRLLTFSIVSLLISWISHSLQAETRRAEQREGDALRELTERRRMEAERAALLAREREARQQAESMQRRLAIVAEQAQEANRMKDEFLATVSHELRTPLHAILGWSRLLRGTKLGEEAATRALETIERNARAQAQLVSDILDVSRIVTGKLKLEMHPVPLAAVIESALEAVRPAAHAKNIQVDAAACDPTALVHGDAGRLQQVVWNLLSNAIKFTQSGGRVAIELRRVAGEVEILVADTGMGIDQAFLPYVFDRFRQADSSASRAHGGLGLGLAIVRHLIELHGGTVRADSAGPGAGATFTVRLPALVSVRPAVAIRPLAPDRNFPPASLAGLRVLAVDDQADARELIAASLERYGATVVTVSSAREALDALAAGPPHVLIGDIGMPDEDGYTLIRRVRERPAQEGGTVPAIALTAYARREDRDRALDAGYQLHLSKPIDDGALVEAVAALAGRDPQIHG